jgi:membrane protease YdiL (CAAX protease family)
LGVLLGFFAGLWYSATGHAKDIDAFTTAVSQNFYFTHIFEASFYFAALLAMRRVLRKRRGCASFAGYFHPIAGSRMFYGALSGLLLCGLASLVLAVLSLLLHPPHHSTVAAVSAHPRSLGHIAVAGLLCVVLAPFTEELFFRGLFLEWLQSKLRPASAALINAAIFALWHLRFLEHPGMVGWTATVLIAALGLLCALWAQRTRSLRAPVAAHSTYNAAVLLLSCH